MTGPVLALSGGIGGAKLALGLYRTLSPGQLTVVANTADDFVHLGLHVSPDIDTVMYTLAGVNNSETGWGRAHETWQFMAALEGLGGETWFQLGDRDLATNVERTRRLRAGDGLGDITRDFCAALRIDATLLPMSDQRVSTVVESTEGAIAFQDYFVRQQCRPVVTGFRFEGADEAKPNPELLRILNEPALRAVIICPSNPYISIDPILSLAGVRSALAACPAPVVAVSPIIGADAVKGPTAKMMKELGVQTSATSVAEHYGTLLDGFVIDDQDAQQAGYIGVACLRTSVMMRNLEDRERLARDVLTFCGQLSNAR